MPAKTKPAKRPASTATQPLHYRVELANVQAHLFRVTLTIPRPAARQVVALPVWIPGSYLVREFAKHLQNLSASQDKRAVAAQQLDKCSWQIACAADKPLVLSYEVYAFDNSVRTAWLDASRGFFNSTSLCLRVLGQEAHAHVLELATPAKASPAAGWQVATGLAPLKTNKAGFGSYRAAHYDELVDCPVELGSFWSGSFSACGVPHRFVVAGAPPGFDGQRLLDDTQKICEAEIRFWHGQTAGAVKLTSKPPYAAYLFMLNAVDDGYGGLEHKNSTALICARKDLPRKPGLALLPANANKQPEGYTTLLGLISHEYFHTWNVKRLRPFELARYDYSQENYTELLWFFEGFTSYYDDLLLRRAGLVDDANYLKLLNKTLNQVLQAPGRQVQSVAQASFDAWVKYYRQDENTPNATISYYTKGALVALCLDLALRGEGKTTLDHVMRGLWERCKAGPMREQDLLDELRAQTGRSYAKELADWVHGKKDLPLKKLLDAHGVNWLDDPAQPAQTLGLRVVENGGSVQVKAVLRGGVAEQAGLASGDEWLGLEVGSGSKASTWRLAKLDELPVLAGTANKVTALVARDKRIHRLPLTLPHAGTTVRLALRDAGLVGKWLGG
jgi:predicted metalloprotease with PDZ domain